MKKRVFATFFAIFITTFCAAILAQEPSKEENMNSHSRPVYFVRLADASANAPELASLPKTVRQGIEFLKTADLSALPLGKQELDGDRLFINVQEYETKPEGIPVFEAHQKYIDIQMIVSGREWIGLTTADVSNDPVTTPYDAEADYELYTPTEEPRWCADGLPRKLDVNAGELVVFEPVDRHAPCLSPGHAEQVRKVVVKCRID